MKRWTTLLMIVCMLGIAIPAMGAMSISKMRQNTRFLTDRMAYELRFSPQQYDDVYEVNYDFINNVRYLMDDVVRGYDYALDRYYDFLDVRNDDLRWILSRAQYRRFMAAEHFYRPIYANSNKWQFRIYTVYNNVNFFYFGKPRHYTTYCGGHYRTHFNNVSYYRTHYHNRYRHEVYDGHYRIRHDKVTYDRHRHRDFHVAVRPPKKEHHHSVARPHSRPNRPQARPERPSGRPDRPSARPEHRPSGEHHRPSMPQARPDRPGRDQHNKHNDRPSSSEQKSRVDRDRRENKHTAPSRRNVKRENSRKDSNKSRERSRDTSSGERSAGRMRTV